MYDEDMDDEPPMNFGGWKGNIVVPPSARIMTDGHSMVLLDFARPEAVVLATERQPERSVREAAALKSWTKIAAAAQASGTSSAVTIGPDVWEVWGRLYLVVHREDGQVAHICPLKHITICGVIRWDSARQGEKSTDAVVYFCEGNPVAIVMPMDFGRAKWLPQPGSVEWHRLTFTPPEAGPEGAKS